MTDLLHYADQAKRAFEAYNAQPPVGKTYDGREVPTWEALPETVQFKWMAAAEAVHRNFWNTMDDLEKPIHQETTLEHLARLGKEVQVDLIEEIDTPLELNLREAGIVAMSKSYAEDFSEVGVPGHNLFMIIAKLAKALDL